MHVIIPVCVIPWWINQIPHQLSRLHDIHICLSQELPIFCCGIDTTLNRLTLTIRHDFNVCRDRAIDRQSSATTWLRQTGPVIVIYLTVRLHLFSDVLERFHDCAIATVSTRYRYVCQRNSTCDDWSFATTQLCCFVSVA